MWWSDSSKQLRKKLLGGFKKWKGRSIQQFQGQTKESEKARLRSWRELQTNIDDILSMNKFRKIQGSEQNTLGALTNENGNQTQPGVDTIKYLTKIHFNKATELRKTKVKPNWVYSSTIVNWEDDIITEQKVEAAFPSFKVKKNCRERPVFTL